MSSTNRGGQRIENDVYSTPAWCVHRLLEALPLPAGQWGQWLEPAAGEGAIIQAVNEIRLVPPPDWMAIEIREGAGAGALVPRCRMGQDFLTWKPAGRFAVAITNPPYSLAQEFIGHAMLMAETVVMLLRLDFLGSERRAPFLQVQEPSVYVLPNRPSFVGGKTDSCEYAWFVFGALARGEIRVLATTPREVRCGRRAA